MKRELMIVLDFGGQYNQLVARRIRECNVYCEIYSYKTDLEKIRRMNPKGIILTEDQIVVMSPIRQLVLRSCLRWGSLYWGSAMERN